jgi:hypothetical protein
MVVLKGVDVLVGGGFGRRGRQGEVLENNDMCHRIERAMSKVIRYLHCSFQFLSQELGFVIIKVGGHVFKKKTGTWVSKEAVTTAMRRHLWLATSLTCSNLGEKDYHRLVAAAENGIDYQQSASSTKDSWKPYGATAVYTPLSKAPSNVKATQGWVV